MFRISALLSSLDHFNGRGEGMSQRGGGRGGEGKRPVRSTALNPLSESVKGRASAVEVVDSK